MRQLRQVLRLHLEAGLSYAQVGRAVALSKSTVGKIVLFARAAGVDCAVAQTLNDAELEARLSSVPTLFEQKQLRIGVSRIVVATNLCK